MYCIYHTPYYSRYRKKGRPFFHRRRLITYFTINIACVRVWVPELCTNLNCSCMCVFVRIREHHSYSFALSRSLHLPYIIHIYLHRIYLVPHRRYFYLSICVCMPAVEWIRAEQQLKNVEDQRDFSFSRALFHTFPYFFCIWLSDNGEKNYF